jgi:hypothetical protein
VVTEAKPVARARKARLLIEEDILNDFCTGMKRIESVLYVSFLGKKGESSRNKEYPYGVYIRFTP